MSSCVVDRGSIPVICHEGKTRQQWNRQETLRRRWEGWQAAEANTGNVITWHSCGHSNSSHCCEQHRAKSFGEILPDNISLTHGPLTTIRIFQEMHVQIYWPTKLRRLCPTGGARGGVVVSGTTLRAGRSLARFPTKSCFQPHYGPGVDSASNRNKYQESFCV
jgi:hypothetical protein